MDLMSLVDPVMASPWLYPLLAALSSADGVLPIIPSEAAILTAGVFSQNGTTSLPLVVAAATIGVFVGDHLVYFLSRSAFGPRLLGRFPRIAQAVAAAGQKLDRRAGLLIVMSRFVPGGRVTMNVASGTTRVPLSRFSPASALAAVMWAAYHAGLGVLGGAAFVENPLLGLGVGLVLSAAVGGLIELVRRRVARRATRPSESGRKLPARAGAVASPGHAAPAGRALSSGRVRRGLASVVAATTAAVVLAAPAAAASVHPERAGLPQRPAVAMPAADVPAGRTDTDRLTATGHTRG